MDETKEGSGHNPEEEIVYGEDTVFTKEAIGLTYDKNQLLDKTKKITVLGLGKNRWGKDFLMCEIDKEEVRLNISKKNKNELIDKFGPKLTDWLDRECKVSGILWEGDIEGRPSVGVTLVFE